MEDKELEERALRWWRHRKKFLKKYYKEHSTILVSKEVKETLDKIKLPGESYDDVLRRLLK
jgi:hypothetical protein